MPDPQKPKVTLPKYDPEPTKDDWKWVFDQLVKEYQKEYIDGIEAKIKKAKENKVINEKNAKIDQLIDGIYKLESVFGNRFEQYRKPVEWLKREVKIDNPDWPFTPLDDPVDTLQSDLDNKYKPALEKLKAIAADCPFE